MKRPKHRDARTLKGVLAGLVVMLVAGIAPQAKASSGYDFICFDRDLTATISFDLEWSTAYLDIDNREIALPATGESRSGDAFGFAKDGYVFRGFAPEGQLTTPDGTTARCHQTRDSLKALALYGSSEGQNGWSTYDVPGKGTANVRAAPSLQSEKIANLGTGQTVTILTNTDEFLDGFFWFKIALRDGRIGYIWGALLCSDADNPELNMVVRRCN